MHRAGRALSACWMPARRGQPIPSHLPRHPAPLWKLARKPLSPLDLQLALFSEFSGSVCAQHLVHHFVSVESERPLSKTQASVPHTPSWCPVPPRQ